CRIAGHTVNDWLSDPLQMPDFLQALQKNGWIKRHQAAENSRFWNLIQGERAEMFGVFNAYERQVLHDWICADEAAGVAAKPARAGATRTFRQQLRADPRSALSARSAAPDHTSDQLECALAGLSEEQRQVRL